MGSTRDAGRAGRNPAIAATAIIISEAAAIVSGSAALTPNSMEEIRRVVASVARRPIAIPTTRI